MVDSSTGAPASKRRESSRDESKAQPRARRRWLRYVGAALAAGALALAALIIAALTLPLPERLHLTDSTVIEYRDGQTAHVFLSPDDKWRVRAPLHRVDPAYVDALLRLEDRRFHEHLGVDPLAVGRSALKNLRRGRVVTGASTITMQLARLLEPRPRTFRSKGIEAFRAFQLELRLSKREILEHYLRFVPYGRNIEGIEAAALGYFGHSAEALTPAEIATLLAVPQAPSKRHPSPNHTHRLRAARDQIARRLLDQGALKLPARADRAAALAEVHAAPVPDAFRPFPREAPHVAHWLRARHPGRERIPTTLDPGLQRLAERQLATAARRLGDAGVHNGAVILADHASGELRALVGNPNFHDPDHGGQLPAFDAPRSPGSALKPLIFALAIDRGLVLPGQLVPDVPTRYGTYTPVNYDGAHDGLVRLDDALVRSLNIPYIELLSRLGLPPFLNALRAAGARHLHEDPEHYGLSAAVGGLEVTPLELAGLYTALATDGAYRPLALLRPAASDDNEEALINLPDRLTALAEALTHPNPTAVPLFAPGAAWLTRQALARRDRPDFPRRRALAGLPPTVHWKTGTSFGHHDAWAAGSDRQHTAVVWLGNLDRTPSSALVGADAAGPVLFDLLEAAADPRRAHQDDPRPNDLIAVTTCRWSGHLAGPACPKTRSAWALARAVPTDPDPYHELRELDLATGLSVTPTCRADRPTRHQSYRVYPAQVRQWMKDQGNPPPEPPAYAQGCAPTHRGPPRITSPQPNETLRLIPGLPTTRQEVPLVATAPAGTRLSWFINGTYLGQTAPDDRLWWTPTPGRHQLTVLDPSGHRTHQTLTVASLGR